MPEKVTIKKELSGKFNRNKEVPSFFGQNLLKGLFLDLKQAPLSPEKPTIFYSHPNGEILVGDAIAWLGSLDSESVDMIFADPPYNINKAEWDTFESQQEYVNWSMKWIEQAARVLKPTGTLYVCGFSEILSDLKLPALQFFRGCRWLVWHYKNKANLGSDWGRSHESILHFRKTKKFTFNSDDVRIPYGEHTLKYPEHPQAETSQYGKGTEKNHLWQPNPKGAKPKDVLEIPETPEIWVKPQELTAARDEAKGMDGPRRVAREIGGVRIGLALGGGGARGWAHLGVLEALEKEHIPIDMIAGTSIGALVGATYARTGSFKETCQLTIGKFPDKRSTKKRIYDYTIPLRGFIKGAKVWKMAQEDLGRADFHDLKIPLVVVAVDIGNGEEVILDSDSIADALRATIAIPGVFEPAHLKGRWLVDGALVNSVPASILVLKGMNYVIGVFLSSRRSKAEWNPIRGPTIINVLTRSYDIIRSQTSEGISELVNVAIYPPIDDFRWDDFHRGEELVKIGREATYAVMDKIKALLP